MSVPNPTDRVALRVLSVEDEPAFTELIRRVLEDEGFAVTIQRVDTQGELERALDTRGWDVVVSDHSMPTFSSQEALRAITARGLDIPFIIMSGYIGEEAAVAAMRAGAHDYVPKLSIGRLGIAVRSALRDATERATLRQRERDLEALHAVAFAAGKALDVGRLSTFVADRARKLLRCDYAALYWSKSEDGSLECIARSGSVVDPGFDVLQPGAGIAGTAFATREAVVVDDYPAWPGRLARVHSSFASAAGMPLFIGDRVAGAFAVGSLTARQFAPEEMRVLSVLAAEVAPAIETSRLHAAAQHAAQYDSLTGLPNRVLFTERLRAQIERSAAEQATFALLYADLDGFRDINAAFGHDAGDAVLRELGVRLRELVGVGDSVGRFGADEFAMLFPIGTGLAQASHAAEQAENFLKEPFVVDGQLVHLAASMGIVAFPEHGRDGEILLERAESAMFAAKRSQARYRIYSADLDPQSQKRITLATELRRALTNHEFVLHYQPQVDCATGAVVAVEALLRWAHPTRGLVSPMEFIPFAEQSGLIVEITPWVVHEALSQLRALRSAGLDLRVAVNVAMRNLRETGFFDQVERLVAESGLPPASLTLEITEGTIMLEPERTLELLQRFRRTGIGVAIDDFGTGYSSLTYLSRLPVDEIKIDKSFVMALDDAGNQAIVDAVVQLGRAFGLRVVAEGVKDGPTWDVISAYPATLAQGFHISRPLPADEFVRWLRTRTELGPTLPTRR
jgi:diguanylate cyclase (GGDEF)-like protein